MKCTWARKYRAANPPDTTRLLECMHAGAKIMNSIFGMARAYGEPKIKGELD